MKSRIIDKVFSVFCLLTVITLSIICNARGFIAGSNGNRNILVLLITIFYILYCTSFALFCNKRKSVATFMIFSIATFIVALMGLLAATFRLDMGRLIPLAIIFLSPFQGMVRLLSSDWIAIHSIITGISVLWISLSIFNFRRCK